MNLDDLKNDWQHSHEEIPDGSVETLSEEIRTHADSFEKTIRWRDWIETVAAILVSVAFGFAMWAGGFPTVSELGMAIIVLGAIEIVVLLHWSRLRGGRTDVDLPVAEFSRECTIRVDRQIRLLRNVNWWYTGPIVFGMCLFFYGILFSIPIPLHISVPGYFAFCLLSLLLARTIYRLNQQAVTEKLLPLREKLKHFTE